MKRLMKVAVVLLLMFTGIGFQVSSAEAISGDYDIVGDSIAAGGASGTGYPYWGYLAYNIKNAAPGIVLTGNYINSFGLYTDAIGGSTSGSIRDRLGLIKNANNYILLVGTNDMATFVPLDTYAQNMTVIISNFLGRGARVYVCTILPRSDNFNYNYAITAFNQRLSQIVQGFADQGEPVKLIDTCAIYYKNYHLFYSLYGVAFANSSFLADGLHPTPYGYSILANYIVSRLD